MKAPLRITNKQKQSHDISRTLSASPAARSKNCDILGKAVFVSTNIIRNSSKTWRTKSGKIRETIQQKQNNTRTSQKSTQKKHIARKDKKTPKTKEKSTKEALRRKRPGISERPKLFKAFWCCMRLWAKRPSEAQKTNGAMAPRDHRFSASFLLPKGFFEVALFETPWVKRFEQNQFPRQF